jgi:hypothetical protein
MEACLLLLGTVATPPDLDPQRLRSAYRRMAMLTHPDSRQRGGGGRSFIQVNEAYLLLRDHLAAPRQQQQRPAGPPRHEPPARSGTRAPGGPRPWIWSGRMPCRRLRLGEFLFYSGAISWNTLIAAIVAQRGSRPTLGQLARARRLLDDAEIRAALAARRPGELLGETFHRLELLDRRVVAMLLAEQRRSQQPFGRHVARLGGLAAADLLAVLAAQRRHNRAAAA